MTAANRPTSSPPAPEPAEPEEGAVVADIPAQVPRPRLLRVAAILTALWGITVVVLWLTTANPAVLSRPQITRADFIITATRPDPDKKILKVEKVWRGHLETAEVTISNLDKPTPVKMPAGETFIVPLSRARNGLKITTLREQQERTPPLVYRATPEAILELQKLLTELDLPAKQG